MMLFRAPSDAHGRHIASLNRLQEEPAISAEFITLQTQQPKGVSTASQLAAADYLKAAPESHLLQMCFFLFLVIMIFFHSAQPGSLVFIHNGEYAFCRQQSVNFLII